MIDIRILGLGHFQVEHLVLDFNGTLACDGMLLDGVQKLLKKLARDVELHILTANTHGNTINTCQELPARLVILPTGDEDQAKQIYVKKLGADKTVCIGNGRNDKLMIQEAAIGIAVINEEGASVEAVLAANVISRNISEALFLLINPLRLVATMRF